MVTIFFCHFFCHTETNKLKPEFKIQKLAIYWSHPQCIRMDTRPTDWLVECVYLYPFPFPVQRTQSRHNLEQFHHFSLPTHQIISAHNEVVGCAQTNHRPCCCQYVWPLKAALWSTKMLSKHVDYCRACVHL